MLNKINIADKFLTNIEKNIRIAPTRCSRIKHKSSDCTICHLNCPTDAITVGAVGTTIKVDWQKKCSGCGICVNLCPTECYTLKSNGHKTMITDITKAIKKDHSLIICCSEYDNEESEKDIVRLECLGILSLADILQIYLNGANNIKIKHAKCFDCISKHGDKILSAEIDELIKLTSIFDDIKDIKIAKTDDEFNIEFTKPHDILIIEESIKPNPKVNRRDLFSFYKNSFKDNALELADVLIDTKLPERTVIDFKQFLPPKRKLFLDMIMNLGSLISTNTATGRYFNNIKIDDSCVYCGMCVRFCPTGALKINEDRTVIKFNPSECVSCNLCKKACFHKKLEYLPTLDLKLFFTDIVLAEKKESTSND